MRNTRLRVATSAFAVMASLAIVAQPANGAAAVTTAPSAVMTGGGGHDDHGGGDMWGGGGGGHDRTPPWWSRGWSGHGSWGSGWWDRHDRFIDRRHFCIWWLRTHRWDHSHNGMRITRWCLWYLGHGPWSGPGGHWGHGRHGGGHGGHGGGWAGPSLPR